MPTSTYTPIASVTLSASASEVVFSGLPQTYRDLVIVINGNTTSTDSNVRYRLNGDTGSNYTYVRMSGTSAGPESDSATETYARFVAETSSYRGMSTAQIMDYSATDKHKTILSRENRDPSQGYVAAKATRWASTSAVTSIQFYAASGSLNTGLTISLYGIAG